MAGFRQNETIEQALDKGAPIGSIAEYFGLSRAEVTECSRRRRIEKWRGAQARAAEHTPPPWSEHEYALLQGLAGIGKVSVAPRVLRRSQEDVDQAMKELGRRARLREEEKIEKRIAVENKAALYQQRMKEEAIGANWLEIQAARRAPSTEAGASIDSQKIDPNITINGKNYTRLLDQAMRIVRARIEIVAAIGK